MISIDPTSNSQYFDNYTTMDGGNNYVLKSMYQPYVTQNSWSQTAGDNATTTWSFDIDRWNADQGAPSTTTAPQMSDYGITGPVNAGDPNFQAYNQALANYQINPPVAAPYNFTNDLSGMYQNWSNPANTYASPMNANMVNILNQVDPNWQSKATPALNAALQAGGGTEAFNNWNQGLIGTSSHATSLWNELEKAIPGLAQSGDWAAAKGNWLAGSDQLSGLNQSHFEIPLVAAIALAAMGGMAFGGAGLLGLEAGSPMAMGGMLGEVGAGISGLEAAGAGALGSAAGAGGAGAGGLNLSAYGPAFDASVVGSAVSPEAMAAAGAYPLSGTTAFTSLPTIMSGGATGGFGGTSSPSLLETLKGAYQSTVGQLPPGSTSIAQKLLGAFSGSGGTGGTSGTGGAGTGGGGTMNGITNAIGSYLSSKNYGDTQDYLKQQLDRAIELADPFKMHRGTSGNLLMQSYTDPSSIWNSDYMQMLDKDFQNTQMARDAAAGQLFNAPERLAQRETNFYKQLNEYRQPLLQMSGAAFNPNAGVAAITGMSPAIAEAGMREQGAMGTAAQQGLGVLMDVLGLGGKGGGGSTNYSSLLNTILGLGGTGTTPWYEPMLANWTQDPMGTFDELLGISGP